MQEEINSVPLVDVGNYEEFLEKLPEVIETYKNIGVLALRGYQFSDEEHKEVARHLGDVFGWNMYHGAGPHIESAFYEGGHSELPTDEPYTIKSHEYLLDWHIEQVYYVTPILAGLWNMHHFSAQKGAGSTQFMDSCQLYQDLEEEDKKLLADAIMFWKKQMQHGSGPFYTRAVDFHPLSKKPTLRIETDRGCEVPPRLIALGKNPATEVEKNKFDLIVQKLKLQLHSNKELLLVHEWEQGDLLIVDLFRMYHSVLGGFNRGERKFKGLGIRPAEYGHELYDSEEKLWKS